MSPIHNTMSDDYQSSSSSSSLSLSSSSSSSYFSSDSQDDTSDADSVGLDPYFHTNYTVTGVTDAGTDIVANIVNDDENIIDVYDDSDDCDDGHGGSDIGRRMKSICDISDIEYRLQTSIFYVEPVTHITCQLMFINSASNTLTQIDTRVMRLTAPNMIDRFDIGRVIKASRYAPDGSLKFRLGSLFVYNAHVSPAQLSLYVTNPDAFSFVTPLTSISSFIIKPTMACFHSLNSIHIVLHSLSVLAPVLDSPSSNSEGRWHASSKPISKPPTTTSTRRTVTITKKALATRRNNNKKHGPKPKYHPH